MKNEKQTMNKIGKRPATATVHRHSGKTEKSLKLPCNVKKTLQTEERKHTGILLTLGKSTNPQ